MASFHPNLEPAVPFQLRDELALSVGEIAQRAGFPVPTVARELRILVQAGVLLAEESDGQARYRANPADPFIEELKAIAVRTRAIDNRLARALTGLAGIELAFAIASIAKGGAAPTGDIELLVIGDIEFAVLKDATTMASADLGRLVSPKLYLRSEWQLKLFEGDKFIRRVAFGPKVFVIGSQEGLDRVGKARKAGGGRKRGKARGSGG